MKKIYLTTIMIINISIGYSQIVDIKAFLNQCPTLDTNINTILNDFEIKFNGITVTDFPCSEPVSAIPVADYSNPLIYLQTLRVIYYMDRYLPSNHLPWTNKNLYDWMKDNVDGLNIVDGVSGGYCCDIIDGKKYFVTGNQNASNREFDKYWRGISGNIDFFAHEVRHADPGGYYHSSCCGITNGCDDTYDEDNLGSYGIQYWLNKSWLNGDIYVGARMSHTPAEISQIINWEISAMNSTYRDRFCNNIPEVVEISDISHPLGQIAILTTTDIVTTSESTASSGGNITFANYVPITERGICWSVTPSPTKLNQFTNCGTGEGSYTCDLTNLIPNTEYFVRAYATSLFGTIYGNEISFTTVLSGTTGIPSDDVFFFPNPAHNVLYLNKPKESKGIIIYDMAGKIVMKSTTTENSIDIQSLQPGQYIIKLETLNAVKQDLLIKL